MMVMVMMMMMRTEFPVLKMKEEGQSSLFRL